MKTSELSEFDLYLFHQGTNYHAYEMLGAHFVESDGKKGVRFAVWAPHAKSISVVGDFNEWDTRVNPMTRGRDGEIWEVPKALIRRLIFVLLYITCLYTILSVLVH